MKTLTLALLATLSTTAAIAGSTSYPQIGHVIRLPRPTSPPLQVQWMKTSHNTYQKGHTPTGETVAWHLSYTTTHIELDLRDSVGGKSYRGNWFVAHGSGADEVTPYCGGTSLSACLADVRWYHRTHPGHPLITVWLDKKQNWENVSDTSAVRSPRRLDDLIGEMFAASEIFRPFDLYDFSVNESLRAGVEASGWPTVDSLANHIMFVITSDAGCTGNDRLEAYVDARGWAANAFVAPSGESRRYVTSQPNCFDADSTRWVAIYNFEWRDADDDGECDGSSCFQVPTAHALHYLTRAWDIDDSREFDAASRQPWGGRYGLVNFIAIDRPWQVGGNGGYGGFPNGTYPW